MSIKKALESGQFAAIQNLYAVGINHADLFEPGDIHCSIGSKFQASPLEIGLQGIAPVFANAALHTEESKKLIYDGIEALAKEYKVEADELWRHLSDGIRGISEENVSATYNKQRLDSLVSHGAKKIDEIRCAALKSALIFRAIPREFVGVLVSSAGVLGFREKLTERTGNGKADPSKIFSRSEEMHRILSGIKDGAWPFLRGIGFTDELLSRYGLDKSKYQHIKEPADVMNATLDIWAAFARVSDREMLWKTLCEVYGGKDHGIPNFDKYVKECTANFERYDYKEKLHGKVEGTFRGDFGFIAAKVEEYVKEGKKLSDLVPPPRDNRGPEVKAFFERGSNWEDLIRLRIVESVVSRLTTSYFKEPGRYSYGHGDSEDASRLDIKEAQKIIELLTPKSILEKHDNLASESFELGGKVYKGVEAGFRKLASALDKPLAHGNGRVKRANYTDKDFIADEIKHVLHRELHLTAGAYSVEEDLMCRMSSFDEAHEYLYIKFLQQKERFDSRAAEVVKKAAGKPAGEPDNPAAKRHTLPKQTEK